MYLSKKISIYECPKCELRAEAKGWYDDPYSSLCCTDCDVEVKYHSERESGWWSVGVYDVGQAYGGPEEGGWWYDTGIRVDPWKVRAFEDEIEARAYMRKLQAEYEGCKSIRIIGFTEKLPVRGFPDRKPVYC